MFELLLTAALLTAPASPTQVCTTGLIGIADCSTGTLGQPLHSAAERAATAATSGAVAGTTAGVAFGAPVPAAPPVATPVAPAPAPAPAPAHRAAPRSTTPLPGVYTVRRGDTLSAIAARTGYRGGWWALARDNGYLNPNKIFVGQQIIVALVK